MKTSLMECLVTYTGSSRVSPSLCNCLAPVMKLSSRIAHESSLDSTCTSTLVTTCTKKSFMYRVDSITNAHKRKCTLFYKLQKLKISHLDFKLNMTCTASLHCLSLLRFPPCYWKLNLLLTPFLHISSHSVSSSLSAIPIFTLTNEGMGSRV
jgi:hypothetical protein